MKALISLLFVCMLQIVTFASAQQRVIIDTDIDSDVDDVGALAMLYNLHHQKKIHLLGVIVTSDDPYAPTCVSALNTYYKLEQLPVGFLEGQPELKNHSPYTRQISKEFKHPLKSWQEAETATATYRKLLSKSPDKSVVIITIGHLSSLQRLLQSSPDAYSALNGAELVNTKVLKWYCMGGQFPEGKEANFYRPDPASTVYCLNNWKKEVIFCGWEVGNKIVTGGEDVKTELSPQHPVYRSYQLYNNFAGRASWDQVAVWLLTEDSMNYFQVDYQGKCHVDEDGSNRWIPGEKSNQGYLTFKDETDIPLISSCISDLIIGKR